MPPRRVDPAVAGVALVYRSPFYCSVLYDQLVFSLFSFQKYPFSHTFTAVCHSELFVLTVGAVQQNG